MKKQKQKPYQVSVQFQQAFSIIIIGLFAAQSLWSLWNFYDAYSGDPSIGGWELFIVMFILLPIIMFLTAWFIRPKQATMLANIFDSLLVTTVGMSVYSAINWISNEIYIRNITAGSGAELSDLYDKVAIAIFLILYLGALLYLRKTRKWR